MEVESHVVLMIVFHVLLKREKVARKIGPQYSLRKSDMLILALSRSYGGTSAILQHRENREIGSYFFKTGKTELILL